MPTKQPNGHGKRIVRSASGPVWQQCQCAQCTVVTPYARPKGNRAASAGTNGFLQRANAGGYNSRIAQPNNPPTYGSRKGNPNKRYTVGLPIGHSRHLQPLNHGTRWSS